MKGKIGLLWVGLIMVSMGCVGMPAAEIPEAGETPPTPSNWTSDEMGNTPSETMVTLSIGNESDLPDELAPHTYRIGNNHSDPRNVSITIWRDTTVVSNRSVAFQPNTSLQINAYRPGNYTIVVDPENAPREVIDDHGEWDCNALQVRAELRPDGQIVGIWEQTAAGCR